MNSVREVAAGRVRRIVPFKTPRGFQRSTPLLRKTLPRDGHTPSPKATKQNRRQFFVAAGGGGRFLQQGAGGQGQCQLGRVRRHRPPRVSPATAASPYNSAGHGHVSTDSGGPALRSCSENQWRTEMNSVREVAAGRVRRIVPFKTPRGFHGSGGAKPAGGSLCSEKEQDDTPRWWRSCMVPLTPTVNPITTSEPSLKQMILQKQRQLTRPIYGCTMITLMCLH